MKPFNLEAALKGAPITDREGNPVELIAYVEKAIEDCQVVTLHSNGNVYISRVNGRYWGTDDSPKDLFMAPVKRTVWVNLYEDNNAFYYDTQKNADAAATKKYKRVGDKAHQIEIEE